MSKERELLERVWASERWNMPEDLQMEIKELLAQPELENNIVCWGSFDLGGKCVGTHETRRLAAQIQGGNEVLPLYLKQEPREPLSEGILMTLAVVEEFLLYCNEDEFIEIARAIEKAHGIGE